MGLLQTQSNTTTCNINPKHFTLISRLQSGLGLWGLCKGKEVRDEVRGQQAVRDTVGKTGGCMKESTWWKPLEKCMLCKLHYMMTEEVTEGNEGYSRMLFSLQDGCSVAWIVLNMLLCVHGMCYVCAVSMSHGTPGVCVCVWKPHEIRFSHKKDPNHIWSRFWSDSKPIRMRLQCRGTCPCDRMSAGLLRHMKHGNFGSVGQYITWRSTQCESHTRALYGSKTRLNHKTCQSLSWGSTQCDWVAPARWRWGTSIISRK